MKYFCLKITFIFAKPYYNNYHVYYKVVIHVFIQNIWRQFDTQLLEVKNMKSDQWIMKKFSTDLQSCVYLLFLLNSFAYIPYPHGSTSVGQIELMWKWLHGGLAAQRLCFWYSIFGQPDRSIYALNYNTYQTALALSINTFTNCAFQPFVYLLSVTINVKKYINFQDSTARLNVIQNSTNF